MEEDKCECWEWMTIEQIQNMKESLFPPLIDFLNIAKPKSVSDIIEYKFEYINS